METSTLAIVPDHPEANAGSQVALQVMSVKKYFCLGCISSVFPVAMVTILIEFSPSLTATLVPSGERPQLLRDTVATLATSFPLPLLGMGRLAPTCLLENRPFPVAI